MLQASGLVQGRDVVQKPVLHRGAEEHARAEASAKKPRRLFHLVCPAASFFLVWIMFPLTIPVFRSVFITYFNEMM